MATASLGMPYRPPGRVTIRRGGLALKLDTRVLGLVALTAAVLALLMIWAMTLGSYRIDAVDVARAVTGRGEADRVLIVRDVRLPRVLCAALLGACFLLLADVIGQHLLPVALPVGVITAAVGAPYFLFLIYRANVRL